MVQLSHSYMTVGKAIALTVQTSVGKVMSLLFNMLSRLVIAFLPRSTFKLMPSTFYYLNVVLGKCEIIHNSHLLSLEGFRRSGGVI